jgi:hypothetical protein
MSAINTSAADMALKLLRELSPRERLHVIAQALPEAERDLSEADLSDASRPLKSLRGLWKGRGFDISAEEIDQARHEVWANFPREES